MNLLQGRIERDGDALHCVVGDQRLPVAGERRPRCARGVRRRARSPSASVPSTSASPPTAPATARGCAAACSFVELLGAERLVQVELDAQPVVADEVLEVARDVDAAAADRDPARSERPTKRS